MENKRTIGLELQTLSNLIRRHIARTATESFDNPTCKNGWIIAYLCENSGRDVFQRDLEDEFSMRRSTVSKMLQLMEKKELIAREPVEHDARLKKLVLTEKAMKMRDKVLEYSEQIENQLINGLSEDELNTFYNLIDRIKSNL